MHIGTVEDLFISDAAKAAYHLWLELHREQDQLYPKRYELDWEKLPDTIQPHCFIMAYLGETVLSIAHAGSAIEAFLGSNVEGQNILATRQEEQHAIELEYYRAVFNQPCAGLIIRRTKNIKGNESDFNAIHLPLLDYRNKVRYLLGIVHISNRDAPAQEDTQNIYGASAVKTRTIIDIGSGIPSAHSGNPA